MGLNESMENDSAIRYKTATIFFPHFCLVIITVSAVMAVLSLLLLFECLCSICIAYIFLVVEKKSFTFLKHRSAIVHHLFYFVLFETFAIAILPSLVVSFNLYCI